MQLSGMKMNWIQLVLLIAILKNETENRCTTQKRGANRWDLLFVDIMAIDISWASSFSEEVMYYTQVPGMLMFYSPAKKKEQKKTHTETETHTRSDTETAKPFSLIMLFQEP